MVILKWEVTFKSIFEELKKYKLMESANIIFNVNIVAIFSLILNFFTNFRNFSESIQFSVP